MSLTDGSANRQIMAPKDPQIVTMCQKTVNSPSAKIRSIAIHVLVRHQLLIHEKFIFVTSIALGKYMFVAFHDDFSC